MAHTSTSALTSPAPVFGPSEAARALGISVSYVDKLRNTGIAKPSVPMGASGRMVYSLDDLRALAAAIGRDLDHDTTQEAA